MSEKRAGRIDPALLRNPIHLLAFGFGVIDFSTAGWLHIKLLLVIILSGFHGVLSRWRKNFAAYRNTHSARFYRIANEVPTVLMIAIVILAVTKPL